MDALCYFKYDSFYKVENTGFAEKGQHVFHEQRKWRW